MKHIGKYEILSELGKGGMGVVYRALDPIIGRLVALKTITAGLATDPALFQRFIQEAQAAGRLQHPNIVTIYEVGEADGIAYIVMEYLEGQSLDRIIKRAMDLRIIHKIKYILEVCRGLQYAHRRRVIHRDIKPSNIFITAEDVVKILDFGIARLTDFSETRAQTATGMILGTMDYLSPELLRGERANEATDIWALGVTTYEFLAYRKPFKAENLAQLLQTVLSEDPPPLSDLVPNCPDELKNMVMKMLRRNPQERFRSMDEILPDLERVYRQLADLSVRELLNLSEEWLNSNGILKASEALREILQIDPANVEAKELLERAQSELKDKSVTAKLESLVQTATANLQEGNLAEARNAVNSAIALDPGYEPAQQLLQQVDVLEHRAETVSRLLQQAREKLANRDFASLEDLAKQILALQADNKAAQSLLQQAYAAGQPTLPNSFGATMITSVPRTASPGVTGLNVLSPPTGFFSDTMVGRSSFFEGDQVRYLKIQESLKFYRDHLNGEYQTLSNQAKVTYYLWIAAVLLGLVSLVSGVILLFLKQFAAGSVSAISTTFVYFIQRVFQQREDHYRSLAAAKHEHLEYGNHWLLVIQSIDAIQSPVERERRQSELVGVLTKKLASSQGQPRRNRTPAPKRKKTKPAGA